MPLHASKKRNFTKNDYKVFHPGGKLGLSLQKVSDVMHSGSEIPIVNKTASLSEAILEMTRCRFGCVGIIDNSSKLVGIFTDGDLRRSLMSTGLEIPIFELMIPNPILLDPNSFAVDVVNTFRNKRIPSAFVCSDGKPVGILHIHDLLQKGIM